MFNLDVVLSNTIHELTPRLASQWPTQKSYKITFLFEKNVVSCTTFAGRLTKLAGHTVSASFIIELSYLAFIIYIYICH